jgi:hypothetical protein
MRDIKVQNNMSNKNEKIKAVIEILKFILSIDDEEIMRSSIESIIETLNELID